MTTIPFSKQAVIPGLRRPDASRLEGLVWPPARLGEALEVLASKHGIAQWLVDLPGSSEHLAQADDPSIERWIEATANRLGVEAEPAELTYAEVEPLLNAVGPALLRLPGNSQPAYLAILGRVGRAVAVLAPDLTTHRLQAEEIRAALCHDLEASLAAEVEHILDAIEIPTRRQAQARHILLRERLGTVALARCWHIRPSPGANFLQQVRLLRLPRLTLLFTGAYAIQYSMWHLALWVVAQIAFTGRFDLGWLLTWSLLLLTIIPFRLCATWLQGTIAIKIGGILRQRIMHGILRLAPEEIRHQGVGQLLGRVMELDSIDSLAPSGVLQALIASIELMLVALMLIAGTGGVSHALLLLVWIMVSIFLGWQYFQLRCRWTIARLEMTHDLVEGMVGHRTRLAQERREHWHTREDQALARYVELTRQLDRRQTILMALVPRGWLIVGLIGFAFAFVSGPDTPAALALSLGGLLSGYRALRKLAEATWTLAGVAIGWKQIAPIFHAAADTQPTGSPTFALMSTLNRGGAEDQDVLIEANDLVFQHHARSDPVLQGCNLRLHAGERLLLEGSSGAGKSTLATILTGMRRATSGLLLFRGLDQQTLGSANWRRQIVAVPQFHENYVLTETFAFNLLMGRHWPPQPEDLAEAEALCHELGLGDLLNRMPAGMLQMVGEAGWQLSHGEKSRLYIARSLLQDADLIVLDESFAALDPETLHLALRCVLNRAKTLMVIAHP